MTVKRGGLDLRYGLYGRLSVNAGYNQANQKYRITTRENRESDTWTTGVRYQPTDLMFYGLTYSQTDTQFVERTNREEVARRNISLVANWRVTGFSMLSGSLGYTRERYEKDQAADFNGVTGSAAWTFTPAGKVSYRVNWLRDTNNQGGFTAAGGLATVSQQRLTNQFSASASWQATAKIAANVQLAHVRYDEERSQDSSIPILNAEASQRGRLNSISLGLDYQPIRSVAVGCDVQRYDRTESVFSRAYSGRALSCSVGFTLD
ncbi:MAG: outer membrane beta-barrel protein [Fimbriimonadales bacterium]